MTGLPGVGKTMLAIGLGMEAVRAGYSVYLTTLSELADQVPWDRTHPRSAERLRVLAGAWPPDKRATFGPTRPLYYQRASVF